MTDQRRDDQITSVAGTQVGAEFGRVPAARLSSRSLRHVLTMKYSATMIPAIGGNPTPNRIREVGERVQDSGSREDRTGDADNCCDNCAIDPSTEHDVDEVHDARAPSCTGSSR